MPLEALFSLRRVSVLPAPRPPEQPVDDLVQAFCAVGDGLEEGEVRTLKEARRVAALIFREGKP
jgi:hypothetical protein